MNRRGFFRLLGKLVTVGAAMSVAPALLKPLEKFVPPMYPLDLVITMPDGTKWDLRESVVAVYTIAS